jgi:hypothetical protein
MGGIRGGGQIAIWMAAYGPKGDDGLPKMLWDDDGKIDKEVAEYWKQNSDLSYILKRDWAKLASSLRGKIHVWVGSMDAYYLVSSMDAYY